MGIERLREKYFGAPTRPAVNPVTASVGTSGVLILENRPKRTMALIVNLSANTLYIGWDREVSSTRGVLVSANGGYISLIYEEDGDLVGQALYAVATAAASSIYVVEVYLE